MFRLDNPDCMSFIENNITRSVLAYLIFANDRVPIVSPKIVMPVILNLPTRSFQHLDDFYTGLSFGPH